MVPIRENLLSYAKYNLKVPVESCAKDMKYIVVHNTANDASAANEIAYMIRNDSSTSFNAAVDDKEIVLGIPLQREILYNCHPPFPPVRLQDVTIPFLTV